MLLLICGLIPLGLGALMPFLKIGRRGIRMAYVLAATLITSALAGYAVFSGREYSLSLFRVTDDLVCRLQLDGAGRVYLALIAFL